MQILLISKTIKLKLKNRLAFSGNQLLKYIESVVHVTQIRNNVNIVIQLLLWYNLHHSILLPCNSYSKKFIHLKQPTFLQCNQMYTNPKLVVGTIKYQKKANNSNRMQEQEPVI